MLTNLTNPLWLERFDLSLPDIHIKSESLIIIKKWTWNYELSLSFQHEALRLIQDYRGLKIIIACNHPPVFTYGKGLQKPRKNQSFNLVDFNPELGPTLPYPFYRIERGGGLTFHHPHQFIVYPIMKLNPQQLSLSNIVTHILQSSQKVIHEMGIQNCHFENELLGLWIEDKKVASLGIAIKHMTTLHGMALNIDFPEIFRQEIQRLNPCGLKSDTYSCLNDWLSLKTTPEDFFNQFMPRFINAW